MLFVNINSGLNIHQLSLADAMFNVLGDDFKLIETQSGGFNPMKGFLKNENFYEEHPYIIRPYTSKAATQLSIDLINKADALRVGGSSFPLAVNRIKSGKLTFRSSERLFKTPILMHYPSTLYNLWKSFGLIENPNYRLLCQSAFLPNDMKFLGNYKEKCYKFGYFTQIQDYDIKETIRSRQNDKIILVWCARFIGWKHPELSIKLAKKLIESGRKNFEIQMIGADNTPLWSIIKDKIEKGKLAKYVTLTGGLPNAKVLERMRRSHIFIFTSDRREGWGAVLNEAMGAGCACVASHDIGAVPYLIKHKVNGLIYKSCSVDSLFENIAYLYDTPSACKMLGEEAYKTITNEWSAKEAAKRLVKLSESILQGHEVVFNDGPCSKAYPCNPSVK